MKSDIEIAQEANMLPVSAGVYGFVYNRKLIQS